MLKGSFLKVENKIDQLKILALVKENLLMGGIIFLKICNLLGGGGEQIILSNPNRLIKW